MNISESELSQASIILKFPVPLGKPFPLFSVLWIMDSNLLVNGKVPDLLSNDPSKPWVIQKFGGTSVGKFAEEIAEQVVK